MEKYKFDVRDIWYFVIIIMAVIILLNTREQHDCFIDYEKLDKLASKECFIPDHITVGELRHGYLRYREFGILSNETIFNSHLEKYLDQMISCEVIE